MARTRSTEVHQRMIEAALRLFAERGFESASMDAIAQAAHVSKPTLYNHWADKEALMLEVMLFVNGSLRPREEVDTGDVAEDLRIVLSRRPPDEFETARARVMPGLMVYSATHPEFGAAWRHTAMQPARDALRQILRRAVRRGQLRHGLNLDASLCILLGPMLYRHIFEAGSSLTIETLCRQTAEAFVRAFAPAKPRA
jgi:AcrR family transcriptional regulator